MTREEKNRCRREKLSGYFFDMSKLSFATLVLGGLTPVFTGNGTAINWATIVLGLVTTVFCAVYANQLLK